jgi:shikimate dehydrogenase
MIISKGKNMYLDNRVTGKTKIIGIIGNPIEHSFSPQLHNTISSFLNVDLVYVPFKVEKNDLEKAVKGLKALNLVGFNVTIPFKSIRDSL